MLLDREHGTFDAVGPCAESLVLEEMVAEAFRARGGLRQVVSEDRERPVSTLFSFADLRGHFDVLVLVLVTGGPLGGTTGSAREALLVVEDSISGVASILAFLAAWAALAFACRCLCAFMPMVGEGKRQRSSHRVLRCLIFIVINYSISRAASIIATQIFRQSQSSPLRKIRNNRTICLHG